MGGNGKKFQKWKIFLHKSSPSSPRLPSKPTPPPQEFLCPITGSLMFDPVVVSSGQTFERASVELCNDLNFNPTLSTGFETDFSTIIPNLALKTTISKWCKDSRLPPPSPPDYSDVESAVHSLMGQCSYPRSKIPASESELLKGVAENPPLLISHASSDLNALRNYSYSSSEESVIANTTPSSLPFTTRPACYSSPSTDPSNSSEIVFEDALTTTMGSLPLSLPSSLPNETEDLVEKLTNLDVYQQEQGVISLRETTRLDEESRESLCTPALLQALKPLMKSRYSAVQTNSVAALVNLSLCKPNKIKIVRSGMVPILIDLLKNGFEESREHAAGAIFSLALEDTNKMAIGVLGGLEPLLHSLRSESESTRNDSALALYHLTLVKSNGVKLVKLGAAGVLLGLLKREDMVGRVVLVVCNLAVSPEGRSALLDANAVEILVERLRGSGVSGLAEATRENCVAALYSLSQGGIRFKALAKEARMAEVLETVVVGGKGNERTRDKAKRILVVLKGRVGGDGEEVDWERLLEGGVSRTGFRVGKTMGVNSTEF